MNGESLLLSAALAVQVLFAACVFWALPTWSRPELFFSITAPRTFRLSPEGRAILARYRVLVGAAAVVSLLALVLAQRLPDEASRPIASIGAAVGLPLIGCIAAFLHARRRVRPHAVEPTPVRAAGPATSVRRGLSRSQWIAYLVPLLLVVVAALALLAVYPSLPDTIPTHFNLQGEADAFSEKSVGILLLPLAIAAALMVFIMVLARWILRALPVRTGDAAALDLERRRRSAIVELLGVILYLTAAVMILVSVAMVAPPAVARPLIVVTLILSLMMGTGLMIWFLIRHGSAFTASSRAAESGPDGAPIGDGTEDRHWKAGLIYYNPDDPAVWVEKRIGIGYTTNMARAEPWFMLAGLVLLIALIVLGAVLVGQAEDAASSHSLITPSCAVEASRVPSRS